MARLTNGNLIGKTITAPTTSIAVGKWNMSDQFIYSQQSIWPKSYVLSGLKMWLDAGNSNSYPGSGSTWYDLSGNGINATKTSAVTYTSTAGGGLAFNGVTNSSYADLSVNNLISGTSAFTFEIWFYNPNGNTGALIDNYGTSYTSNSLWIFSGGLWINNGSGYINNYASRISGTHLISCTRDSSGNCKTYFDNVLDTTSTNTASIPANINWRIGADVNSGAEAFNGNIYIIRVYTRDLSATELTQNFNIDRSRFGL